jgi:hypothetical protein
LTSDLAHSISEFLAVARDAPSCKPSEALAREPGATYELVPARSPTQLILILIRSRPAPFEESTERPR